MRRFLFIGHDASRSGAPIILRDLARWIKVTHPDVQIDFLLLSGGELEAEFHELGETIILRPNPVTGLRGRIARRLFGDRDALDRVNFANRTYTAVLGNTIVALRALSFFSTRNHRTICWMHELEYVVDQALGAEEFRRLAGMVDHFIVPSRAVADVLDLHQVETPRTQISDFSAPSESDDVPADLLKYGIEPDAFLVGGAGTIEWRKGVDLFAMISMQVRRERPDIQFVWVGSPAADTADAARIRHDIGKMPAALMPTFIDATPQFRSILARFDVFAFPSRADASPVVVHEAARFAKPIICFAESGGTPEFVGDEAGVVVPFGDIAAFSRAILDLADDSDKRKAYGARAFNKVQTAYSAEKSCAEIYAVLSAK
jgi:glycosyltransferase involved in cell wall biosynthesis